MIKYDAYENFKEEQFSKLRPGSFQLRSMISQTIKEDYIKPIQLILNELSEKLGTSMDNVTQRIEQYIEIIESGQVVLNRGYDIERYQDDVLKQIEEETSLAEKSIIKVLNQLVERRNSLVDKFSVMTILRAKGNNKKYHR